MNGTDGSPPAGASEDTWFGFRPVAPGEKQRLVRGVFDSVARRYDIMNDLMSGGIHRLWKAEFVRMLAPRAGQRFLDVAGGTGDIAFRIADRLGGAAAMMEAAGRITVCDLTPAMLAIGRDRAIDAGTLGGIDWIAGDAQDLPVRSGSCDAYTIAFGLRNVTDIDRALREAKRVLKPGGRFLCLEFSQVALAPLARLYDLYSFTMLPLIGAMVTGDRASYQYLVESIRRFPDQESLVRRIAGAGLARPSYRNLSGGIAAIHSAWRV